MLGIVTVRLAVCDLSAPNVRPIPPALLSFPPLIYLSIDLSPFDPVALFFYRCTRRLHITVLPPDRFAEDVRALGGRAPCGSRASLTVLPSGPPAD
ncbi:hypothetical protein ASPZODRAFT_281685 [Penicilliopsis zonata CBS 506.65]|uniref:Uncharacterized protein n=1 Tax=Penicilliopsis zonata CBS 506.65 TaxID=1073090 RepID=A0A1L9SUY5_9EURO|nr:hypothetical protein ASPZODRAFT_281685 [Penicilliopsis zonata CBS 506.65]OJJ50887.1 hypothetical protein ASPZODRAFT_281685 [Penicilliopsis zonata CBS 506.65]